MKRPDNYWKKQCAKKDAHIRQLEDWCLEWEEHGNRNASALVYQIEYRKSNQRQQITLITNNIRIVGFIWLGILIYQYGFTLSKPLIIAGVTSLALQIWMLIKWPEWDAEDHKDEINELYEKTKANGGAVNYYPEDE